MQSSWLFYSICATLLFGFGSTLYKVPSAKGHNRYATGIWSVLTSCIISGIILLFIAPKSIVEHATPMLLSLTAVWGVVLACMNLLQIYCLSHLETNTHYPVSTSGSLISTILIGLFLFDDRISNLQWLGIGLVIITIYLFVFHKGGAAKYTPRLLAAIGLLMLLGATSKIILKIAVDAGLHIPTFQTFQYFFAFCAAILIYTFVHRKNIRKELFSGIHVGTLIGCASVAGNTFYMHALVLGPFQLVNAVHSLYIIATAYFGALLFKEQLTKKKIGLLLLAVLSIIIVRVG